MSDYYNAFDISPVPAPGADAVAPDLYRGIYGMPSFVTIATTDLAASIDFWTRGLGFFDLFSVPGTLVHLRRWAFQDVLLVPRAEAPAVGSGVTISFACVLDQIDGIVEACRAVDPNAVREPRDTPWNTRDVEIVTPEGARVVFTAAKQYDPSSEEAANLAAIGITADSDGTADNGDRA